MPGTLGDIDTSTRRDLVTPACLVLAALLLGHGLLPRILWVDSLLPWFGLLVVPLALFVRTRRAALALLVPVLVLVVLFGRNFLSVPAAGPADFRVASQNLDAGNPQSCAALRKLTDTGADLVAAQELTGTCSVDYPYEFRVGTVGLWSRFPISDSTRLDLDLGWYRALRSNVDTPRGPVTVFVAHLGSVRPGATEDRDRSLRRLAELAGATEGPVLVLGDLNTASTDRELDRFAGFADAHQALGQGFGFTWPAAFPLVRLDHMLYRGLGPVSAGTLDPAGSDHLGVTAQFSLRGHS